MKKQLQKIKMLFAAFIVLALGSANTCAQSNYNWTGATSTDFNLASNWDAGVDFTGNFWFIQQLMHQ